MRVLQLNSVYAVGSTGRIVQGIEGALAESGHDSLVAYGLGHAPREDRHFRMQSRVAVKSSVLETRLFGKHGFYNKRATRRLLSWVAQAKPDLIHLHNIHGHYVNIAMLFDYLAASQIPVVWTLHDCWALTGHCAHFEHVGCEKWRNGCFSCEQQHQYPNSWLFDRSRGNYREKRKLFHSVDRLSLVTPSEWLAGVVDESYLSGYPVKVINTGIDLAVFKPTNTDFRRARAIEDAFVILGVAPHFTDRKGFHHFTELAAMLQPDEVIVLVGVSTGQMRGLPRNVVGIAHTRDAAHLAELYSCADVFVNPTLEDTFPTVNIEALACGTPVVTFSTGGSAEAVDSSTGLVVGRGDTAGLYAAAQRVKTGGKGLYQSACVARARRLYDSTSSYSEYLRLYESLR